MICQCHGYCNTGIGRRLRCNRCDDEICATNCYLARRPPRRLRNYHYCQAKKKGVPVCENHDLEGGDFNFDASTERRLIKKLLGKFTRLKSNCPACYSLFKGFLSWNETTCSPTRGFVQTVIGMYICVIWRRSFDASKGKNLSLVCVGTRVRVRGFMEEDAMKGTVPHEGVDAKCFETTFVLFSSRRHLRKGSSHGVDGKVIWNNFLDATFRRGGLGNV